MFWEMQKSAKQSSSLLRVQRVYQSLKIKGDLYQFVKLCFGDWLS